MNRQTGLRAKVSGLVLGLMLFGYGPGVQAAGGIQVLGINSGATYSTGFGEKDLSEQFRGQVRFAFLPSLTDGTSSLPQYDPQTHDVTVRFHGGLDHFGQKGSDLEVTVHAGKLTATGKGQWASATPNPLAGAVSVVQVAPNGSALEWNPAMSRLTVKVQALTAANLYIAELEWVRGFIPPGANANPALDAARVVLEVAGGVVPPDALTGEARPVGVESVYRSQE